MDLPTLFWPALAIVLFTITYFRLDQNQRSVVLTRLRLGSRASSNRPNTPSLEEQKTSSSSSSSKSNDTLASTLPPSQREHLFIKLLPTLSPHRQRAIKSSKADYKQLEKSLLGLEEDYRTAPDTKFSFSGFSIAEIKALLDHHGDDSSPFLDYASLSDVPPPQPYREFKIETARPRPYRPFRWAYHQTMSLTKLDPDFWLELDLDYATRIAQRVKLYEKHGSDVLQALPGSELACRELMEMVLQWMCARYPQYFSLSSSTSSSEIFFANRILGTRTCVSSDSQKHPLIILLENIPEDFALMLRHPSTGHYHFRAGLICSALGWNVAGKMGKSLHDIHAGIVPHYESKMNFSMDRFFAKSLPPGKPIQRGSWGLEVDTPLYMPPGDPHELHREKQDPDMTKERMHLRVDWQTFRRMPLSGSVAFNFKGLFTPVEEFRDEAYVPSLVLKVLREGDKGIMGYKNTWHTEHIVIPMLEEFEREQIEKGIIEKDWEPRTLDEAPYFPGWEDKWHGQQGF